jgi:hypothetical protein
MMDTEYRPAHVMKEKCSEWAHIVDTLERIRTEIKDSILKAVEATSDGEHDGCVAFVHHGV